MANLLPPTDGIIICTNLTCVLKDGKVREPDLVWMLLYSLSLNSEVYVHRNDIIDGKYASYVDGVRVNFTPQIVSKDELQEASETGVRKRPYAGRFASIATNEAPTVNSEVASEDQVINSGQVVETKSKKIVHKAVHKITAIIMGPRRFSLKGTVDGNPAETTFIISAIGLGFEKAKFKLINCSEALSFKSSHSGLVFGNGSCEIEVVYEFDSLDIEIRCLESIETKYITLWK